MTDRDAALRGADLALADIDRVLAPRNTPIDDLVHDPYQTVVDIADTVWYGRYASDEREEFFCAMPDAPDGRHVYEVSYGKIFVDDAEAQSLADAEVAIALSYFEAYREAVGGRPRCWRCRDLVVFAPDDDVCSECRQEINAWRGMTSDTVGSDRGTARRVYAEYVATMKDPDSESVDGVPIHTLEREGLYVLGSVGVATLKNAL